MFITVNCPKRRDEVQVNTNYVEYVEPVRGVYDYLAIHMHSGKVIEAAMTMEDWLRLTKQEDK